jgi:NADH-quinone oxidoreductase subunit G
MANRAGFPPGDAREDWAIIRALSELVGKKLGYDSLSGLRQAMFAKVPHLMRLDQIAPGSADDVKKLAGGDRAMERTPFTSPVADFYLTNPIARASATMAECSNLARRQALQAAE